jgi:hypothetical protein
MKVQLTPRTRLLRDRAVRENGRQGSLTHTTRAIPQSSLSRTNSRLRDDVETTNLRAIFLACVRSRHVRPQAPAPHVPPRYLVWPCSRSRQPSSPSSPRASPSFSRHVMLHDHMATRCLVSSLISSLSFFSHSTQPPDIHPTSYVLLDRRGADTLPI